MSSARRRSNRVNSEGASSLAATRCAVDHGTDAVAGERIADSIRRNEDVALAELDIGDDEPEPARVFLEGAGDLIGHRGQPDLTVLIQADHRARGQVLDRLAEVGVLIGGDTQVLGELVNIRRLVRLVLEVVEESAFVLQ